MWKLLKLWLIKISQRLMRIVVGFEVGVYSRMVESWSEQKLPVTETGKEEG